MNASEGKRQEGSEESKGSDCADSARLAAKMLLDIKSVNFRAEPPFKLASGLNSPSYIDCRMIISFPKIRSALMDLLSARILSATGIDGFDVIAGGETAGIPFGAFIAERLGLPMIYVRKKPKGYGRNAQIEGVLREGQRVLLIEDLATDGGSKIKFVEAIRGAGAICDHTAVVFFYDIFPKSAENLAANGITLHHLTNWRHVLDVAREEAYFDKQTLDAVEGFLGDPLGWSGRYEQSNAP